MYRNHLGRKHGNHFRHPQQTLEIPAQSSQIGESESLAAVSLPTEVGMRVVAIRRGKDWIIDPDGDEVLLPEDVLILRGAPGGIPELRVLAGTGMGYGIAVIALTIIVRGALFPLSRKSQISMRIHGQKMQRLKPKMDAIKEKFKKYKLEEDDPFGLDGANMTVGVGR